MSAAYTLRLPLRQKLALKMESPAIQRPMLLLLLGLIALLTYAVFYQTGGGNTAQLKGYATWIVWLFAVELALRVYAQGFRFFRNIWNLLDAVIICLALYPPFLIMSLLRIIRVMRALGLLPSLPCREQFAQAASETAPAFAAGALMLFVVYFTYGLIGHHLFQAEWPQLYGLFDVAMLTAAGQLFGSWPSELVHAMSARLSPMQVWLYFLSYYVLVRAILIALAGVFVAAVLKAFLQEYAREILRGAGGFDAR